MILTAIIEALSTIAPPVIEWAIEKGKANSRTKLSVASAYQSYKAELKLNCAILEHIKLEKIDTRDISSPAVKGIASKLKTKAAETLLISLLSYINNPKKATKVLSANTSKADSAEAKKVIKAIISVTDKTHELQCFTTISKAEQEILKGFYVRARIKHIKDKSQYIIQRL